MSLSSTDFYFLASIDRFKKKTPLPLSMCRLNFTTRNVAISGGAGHLRRHVIDALYVAANVLRRR